MERPLITRREVLKEGGAAALAATLAGCVSNPESKPPERPSLEPLEVREGFGDQPVTRELIESHPAFADRDRPAYQALTSWERAKIDGYLSPNEVAVFINETGILTLRYGNGQEEPMQFSRTQLAKLPIFLQSAGARDYLRSHVPQLVIEPDEAKFGDPSSDLRHIIAVSLLIPGNSMPVSFFDAQKFRETQQ